MGKFQYSGHLMQKADSLEKTLMLGKIEGRRIRGRLSNWTTLLCGASQVMLSVKNPPANAGVARFSPRLGRSPGIGNSNPLQYSFLEKSMDRGAWWATVYGEAKSQTRLSNFIRHWWKKLKTHIYGKVFYSHELEELVLLKHPCTNSKQSVQNFHGIFHRIITNNSKICMEPHQLC